MLGVSKEMILDQLPTLGLTLAVNTLGAWYRLRRYTPAMRALIADWARFERLPQEAIESQQLKQLRYILSRAKLAPYYRRQMEKVRFDPDRVTSIRQLEDLPLLGRQELINHFNEMLVPGHGRRWLDRKSSGTTGDPVRYRQPQYMAYDQGFAMLYGFYAWHGIKPLGRRATLAGRYLGRREGGVTVVNFAENQLLMGIHALRRSNVKKYRDALARFHPSLLHGHPSALRLFVDLAREAGLSLPSVSRISITGETLLEDDRSVIMNAFGGILFGTYGMGENCVAACECEKLDGYHLHPMIGITELVDTGAPVREIVATSLLNDVMPLIRYRTGDLADRIDKGVCACGRTWPRLHGILGRIDDKIITANGEIVIPVMLRTDIGKRFKMPGPYSIVQHVERGRYSLRLFADQNTSALEQLELVCQYLEMRFGPRATVKLDIRPYSEFLTRRAKHKIVMRE